MTSFAFVFPGQGSQSVGMLDAWGDNPVVAQTLAEASDAMGEDMAKLIHEGPKEALALTTNTQPVMLVAAVAAYRVWLAEGGAAPSVVAAIQCARSCAPMGCHNHSSVSEVTVLPVARRSTLPKISVSIDA